MQWLSTIFWLVLIRGATKLFDFIVRGVKHTGALIAIEFVL